MEPVKDIWNWKYVDAYLDALAAHQPRLAMVEGHGSSMLGGAGRLDVRADSQLRQCD